LGSNTRGSVKDGNIKDEDKLVFAIKEAVQNLRAVKYRPGGWWMSLPENKAFFTGYKMPKLNDKDLRDAVIFEAERNLYPCRWKKFTSILKRWRRYCWNSDGDSCEVLLSLFPAKRLIRESVRQ